MNSTNASVIVMNPWYALIAIPLVVITIAFFFRIPKQKRLWTKNLISLGLHFIIAATLTLTFIDIQYLHTTKETELIIMADCSDSEEDSQEKIDEIIDDVYAHADGATKICVVAYAKTAEKITDFGAKYNDGIQNIFKSDKFDRTSTNFENALKYVNTLYSQETVRRLMIVSDGVETDGTATKVLDDLIHNEVTIDCVYTKDENVTNEIALTDIKYVDRVFQNRDQTVTASIRTFKEEQVTVNLWRDGAKIDSQDVQINRGLNKVEFELPTDEVRTSEYKITVEKRASSANELNDYYTDNNQKSFIQDVTDQFKVLILTSEENGKTRPRFQEMGVITSAQDVTEYWYKDTAIPYDLETLIQYDEFIFYDVNVKNIFHAEEFIGNIFTCVASYGKSLQNFGDTNLHGVEGNVALETYADMLPIQLEGNNEKAVVLNIDVSGSMTGNPLAQAKAGAIACIDILNDNDYMGVVNFSDEGTVIQPLTSVNNTASIESNINRMETIGGTEMNAGLMKCEEILVNTTFEYKYVITLSDGEPFEPEGEIIAQVEKMAQENIICSFINIDNPSGEALLTNLATAGYGEYYMCTDVNELVDVMIAAVSIRSLSNLVQNKDCPIIVNKPNDPIMKNIGRNDFDGSPLRGYYVARMKPDAETVLATQYVIEENGVPVGTTTVPLYAYWQFGKGSVSAFTSNLGNWSSTFRSTDVAKKFFKNAWNAMLPEQASHEQIQFTYETKGCTTDVHVYAADPDTNANVTLKVTDPKGAEVTYGLYFDGYQYSANIPTENLGTYRTHVTYIRHKTLTNLDVIEEKLGEADFNLYFDYSSEYNVFNTNDGELLYQLATARENVKVNEADYSHLTNELEYRSYRSTNMWFLIATLVLFLIDVFVRKGEAKKKKKEYTMGQNRSM